MEAVPSEALGGAPAAADSAEADFGAARLEAVDSTAASGAAPAAERSAEEASGEGSADLGADTDSEADSITAAIGAGRITTRFGGAVIPTTTVTTVIRALTVMGALTVTPALTITVMAAT